MVQLPRRPGGSDRRRRRLTRATFVALVLAAVAVGAVSALADGGATLTAARQQSTPSLTMAMDQPSYTSGQAITITWSGWPAGNLGNVWIDPASTPVDVHKPASNSQFINAGAGIAHFAGLAPGAYQVRVVYVQTGQLVATDDFSVTGASQGGGGAGGQANPSPSPSAGSTDPNRGRIAPTKRSYRSGKRITVRWSGFNSSDAANFWFTLKGAAKTTFPQGPYGTASGSTGSFSLPSPGPGATYEVQWVNLHVSPARARVGGTFTVGGAHAARVPGGHYGCYTAGLTRSSINSISIVSKSRYQATGGAGAYKFSKATQTLHLTSGPLKGRVAHFQSASKKALVFLRRENLRHGRPTIDDSDTYCYLGRR